MDFQDALLDEEEIGGYNILVGKVPEPGKQLTLEEAKQALRVLDAAFKEPRFDKEMRSYFEKARVAIGQDLSTTMNYIQPIGFEIQYTKLPQLGYEASYKGLVQLCMAIRVHQHDSHVWRLKAHLAQNFLPHWYRQTLPHPDEIYEEEQRVKTAQKEQDPGTLPPPEEPKEG